MYVRWGQIAREFGYEDIPSFEHSRSGKSHQHPILRSGKILARDHPSTTEAEPSPKSEFGTPFTSKYSLLDSFTPSARSTPFIGGIYLALPLPEFFAAKLPFVTPSPRRNATEHYTKSRDSICSPLNVV